MASGTCGGGSRALCIAAQKLYCGSNMNLTLLTATRHVALQAQQQLEVTPGGDLEAVSRLVVLLGQQASATFPLCFCTSVLAALRFVCWI